MSKKLQGNGLWESSRMLLPQHKEQSLLSEQQTSKEVAAPPAGRDIEMIRQSIVLPMVLQIVEHKRAQVEQSQQPLKSLYAAAAKLLSAQLRKEISGLKRELLGKQILLPRNGEDGESIQNEGDEVILTFRYTYQSRPGQLSMTRNYLKDSISVALGRYMNMLIMQMQEAWGRQ